MTCVCGARRASAIRSELVSSISISTAVGGAADHNFLKNPARTKTRLLAHLLVDDLSKEEFSQRCTARQEKTQSREPEKCNCER